MKLRIYQLLTFLICLLAGYIFYLHTPTVYAIVDVSKPESFKVYKKTSGKPLSIDLHVQGNTDSTFNIRIMGLPSYIELFNTDFDRAQIDYTGKIDYYSGKGIAVFYTPKGVTRGDATVSIRINADF